MVLHSGDSRNRAVSIRRVWKCSTQFNQLDREAQADIAVTLMYCADRLPPVFHAEDLSILIATVNEIVRSMAQQPDIVH